MVIVTIPYNQTVYAQLTGTNLQHNRFLICVHRLVIRLVFAWFDISDTVLTRKIRSGLGGLR